MKKIYQVIFCIFLVSCATMGIWRYYESLPIRGSYETHPVNYPLINKNELKEQLSTYSYNELCEMKKAGLEAIKWQSLLKKVDSNVVSDVIKNYDQFYIGDRYPHDESVDEETLSSYFYHSHRSKEHGHFHIYFADENVMDQFNPISTWDRENRNTHLIAISMHPDGEPIGLFIPNQWITKDQWYSSSDTLEMLDRFEISHPYPSWPTNQWVNLTLKLFRPQIKAALDARDRYIQSSNMSIEELVKNKKLDVLSSISLSIPDQMEAIEELLIQKKCK